MPKKKPVVAATIYYTSEGAEYRVLILADGTASSEVKRAEVWVAQPDVDAQVVLAKTLLRLNVTDAELGEIG